MIDPYVLVEPAQSWLFEAAVLPLLHAAGYSGYADDVFDALGTSLLGLLFVLTAFIAIRPLEWIRPIEQWRDRRAVRVDVLYTFLDKSGVLPLVFFGVLAPLWYLVETFLHLRGYVPWHLEDLVPGLRDAPLAAFFIYVLVIDFAEYWRHRLQHRFNWWWGLHSIHHSQRQMSFWCDSRNHLLDGVLQAVWLSTMALAIGVPGSQFVLLVILMQFIEALSHANARIRFGRVGEWLLVSPWFHRLHHGIGVGHEGHAHGCNFATVFPVWDILFGTARYQEELKPTGIRDQLDGADYGEGFWSQQRIGLLRMLGRQPGVAAGR
jgi:sterol desaturase/sphingolipid hydroxylase (fatty acid hydroxylase superfamily)